MAGADQPTTVTIGGRRLRLTNLTKVLYPVTGTTKADVIGYYAEIAPVMLPHCAGRPATRKRWPNGVGTAAEPGEMFFQKNLDEGTPDWVVRGSLEHSSKTYEYPLVDDAATLVWLAQVAALEIHVPQWRFGSDGTPHNPDRLVLDLDPGPGAGLAECAEVALLARPILTGMGLDPVPVTSGSKGIHLYAALDGSHTSEQISEIAHELARVLEADHPDLVVSDMKKSLRQEKVLVDWSQNNGSKTTIAPYSLRGLERPTVAVPRTWAELAPGLRHLEMAEVLTRVREVGDPMADLSRAADRAGGGTPRDRLAEYRAKRDPERTPEPVPDRVADPGEPIFVIQEHHARRLHWDLRLAHDGVLVSWALPKGVPVDPERNNLAVQTEDHPMEYATFSGTIPAGEYGAGEMFLWDSGTYELEKWREGKEVIVTLHGRPDGGLASGPGNPARVALIRTGGRRADEDNHWLIHLMRGTPQRGGVPEHPRSGDAEAEADDGAGAGDGGLARSAEDDDATATPEGNGTAAPDGVAAAPRGRAAASSGRTGAGGGPARPRGEALASATTPEARPRVRTLAVEPPERGPWADTPRPMLATPGVVGDIGAGRDWALEMKWDGIRAVVLIDGDDVRLVSRRGNELTAAYPELAGVAATVHARRAILDGEIVAFDDRGRPSFSVLQQRMNLTRPREIAQAAATWPVRLILFDVLEVDGLSWRDQPYDARRQALDLLVDPDLDAHVQVPPAYDGDVDAAMEASRSWNLEGIVAKQRDSPYLEGRRTRAWIKVKHSSAEEVVVLGWKPGQGSRAGRVGSLLLAMPDQTGELSYVGKVGTGFTEKEASAWLDRLRPIERATPAAGDVPRPDARNAHWVEPQLVAEVEYSERTTTGRLRHPRWRGWRPDKDPEDL